MDFPQVSPMKRELLSKATQTYYEALKRSSLAKDYLTSRGITGEAARYAKLGFVEEPAENHDQMVGMLAIPFITPTGVVAIRFRRLEGEGHKYHQEAGSGSPLYNVRDLHQRAPHIAICEGELDGLVLSQLVGVPSVALAGTGNWGKRGKYYKRLLQDYERVFVVMDPDKPGQETARVMLKDLPNAVNIILPGDVNETFLSHGKEFILEEMGLWESYEMPLSA